MNARETQGTMRWLERLAGGCSAGDAATVIAALLPVDLTLSRTAWETLAHRINDGELPVSVDDRQVVTSMLVEISRRWPAVGPPPVMPEHPGVE